MEYLKLMDEIKRISKTKGFKIEKIMNVGKKKEYPLYKITISNPGKPKKTICFSAGIHGDEIAGPLAVKKFIQDVNKKEYKGIKIIIFPVDNPYGFEKNKRRNYQNKDMNRHFLGKRLKGDDKKLY